MHRDRALYFLLLRQLRLFRHAAPPGVHAEVARSLRISEAGDRYKLRWTRAGELREADVPKADFTFYRRGDFAAAPAATPESAAANDDAARALAARIYEVPLGEASSRPGNAVTLEAALPVALLALVVAPHGAGALGFAALMLAAWLCDMFFPRLRVAVALASALLPYLGLPWTALLWAGGQLFVSLADADWRGRAPRSIAYAAAAFTAAYWLGGADLPAGTALGYFAVAFAGGSLIAAARAFYGVHASFVPLLAPVAAAALLLDGVAIAATAGVLIVSALELAWRIARRSQPGQESSEA